MLEEVKLYLRVDGDIEDALISELIASAEEHIKTASGKTKLASGADIKESSLYKTAIKMLVSHWYDNRGTESVGRSVMKISNTYDMILAHITTSEEYIK